MKSAALVTLLTLSASFAILAQNESTLKPMMRSSVFQFPTPKGGPANPTSSATYQNLFDNSTPTLENFACHITTLNPGKAPHPPHKHPYEEFVVIKEGSLEVMQNGVTNIVNAGGIIFCASNEIHGWRNPADKPATYYVFKIVPHDLPKTTQPSAK